MFRTFDVGPYHLVLFAERPRIRRPPTNLCTDGTRVDTGYVDVRIYRRDDDEDGGDDD